MGNMPIKELVTQLEQELIRMGYAEATLKYYRTNWKKITEHFDRIGETHFSESVAMQYVDDKCDFFKKEANNELTQSNIYLFRIVRMMGDFAQHRMVLRRYARTLSRINEPLNKELLVKFKEYCGFRNYSASTCKSYNRVAENFLCYMEAYHTPVVSLTAVHLDGFTKTLLGYSYKMVEFMLCGTRAFLRFLHKENIIMEDFSESLPNMQTRKHTRIPSVWAKEDLLKLMEAIDRGNPSGKRDYAMILLVARLGLRSIDVKHLKFSNLNWNEQYLELPQSKTGQLVRLPLLKDVGWAVIDYIKNGRPVSDSPCIFLRHLAPIAPFSDDDHLHQIIVKYMRLAKIPVSGKKKVGMHSFRHTLATALMENHVPVEDIAGILGQQNTETTPTYLKTSLDLLRECALSSEVD